MRFADGTSFDPDAIVMSTGYKVDMPFLKDELRNKILVDPDNNDVRVRTVCICCEMPCGITTLPWLWPRISFSVATCKAQTDCLAKSTRDVSTQIFRRVFLVLANA